MTDKLFDDFFKKKLEDHDSGAPMHVWEKVRRELHEDDDDKGIIWWRNPLWLIALFLFNMHVALFLPSFIFAGIEYFRQKKYLPKKDDV